MKIEQANLMDKKKSKRIEKFVKDKNTPGLIKILRTGMFDERIAVMNALEKTNAYPAMSAIEDCIDDNVQVVSEKAMTVLEGLKIEDSVKERIENKRNYWKELETEKERKKEIIQQNKLKHQNKKIYIPAEGISNYYSRMSTGQKTTTGIGIVAVILIIIKLIIFFARH